MTLIKDLIRAGRNISVGIDDDPLQETAWVTVKGPGGVSPATTNCHLTELTVELITHGVQPEEARMIFRAAYELNQNVTAVLRKFDPSFSLSSSLDQLPEQRPGRES